MTKVLYICKANVGRSQIAEEFHRKSYPDDEIISAGTFPEEWEGIPLGRYENLHIIKCLDKRGYNLRRNISKKLTPQMVEWADIVVSMAEKETWPDYLANLDKLIHWDIFDGYGRSLEDVNLMANLVEENVRGLVKQLHSEIIK